jgi:serine/threonine protein kinase
MKDETSIFGARPELLDRLVFEALQDSEVEEAGQTASLGAVLERPGGQIERYKLLSILGEGGMGIVYLAEQAEPIRRQVALKIIKPGMDSKRVIARFEAERQALALLDHPNIAHVYDAGTTEASRPYFVMEYVKGLSITEHCDHHKLTIKERLRLFQQVCQAVQHAHQKGIIHRDIKPSNILVSTQDDQAVLKIIDFGVAKALSQPLTERTLATENSQLLGTPEYMSPEQVDMATEDIDTRSDIYSLGVLLYVLLTGALPFDSDTLRTGGMEHIRQVIRETDPKTPSTRLMSLGEEAAKVAEERGTEISILTKRLKKELEWIPLKAMRKERAERYRSASELADDIENYLKGTPLIAGPLSTGYKVKKFIRRNRVLVGGIATIVVVLVAGIVVSTVFAVGQARALDENQLITDFLENDVLGSAEQANVDEATISYTLDAASKSLAAGKFKDKPLIEARICLTLGKTYTYLGEYDKGEQHIRRATEIYQQHLGQKHPDTLRAMGRIGWVCLKQGRHSEMEQIYTRVLQLGQGVLSVERQVDVKNMLGVAYYALGKNKKAELLYEEILQIVQNKLEGKHSLLPWFKGNLAVVYLLQGRYDEAEQIYEELIRADEESENYDGINPNLYKSLGVTYRSQGRYDEAEKFLTEALKASREQLGSEHPQVIGYMRNLALLHLDQERYDDAEKLLLEAVDVSYVKLGDTHPRTLKLIINLIALYEAWNKPEKANQWRSKLPQTEAEGK